MFFFNFDSQVILMKLFLKSLFLKEQIKKEEIQFLLKRAFNTMYREGIFLIERIHTLLDKAFKKR